MNIQVTRLERNTEAHISLFSNVQFNDKSHLTLNEYDGLASLTLNVHDVKERICE